MSKKKAKPGWYDDPDAAGHLRYWDGTQWTTHTAPNRAPRRRTWLPMVIALGLIVALVGVWVVLSRSSDEAKAQRACHEYVEGALKAPATADFSDEYASDNGDETWTVHGTVDSENGFGAKIRNNFTCEVSKISGMFRVDDAHFSEDG